MFEVIARLRHIAFDKNLKDSKVQTRDLKMLLDDYHRIDNEYRLLHNSKDASKKDLIKTIEKLWGIIDDIDSYGDMAKGDDKLFRTLVEKRQAQRWETGITTNGYVLDLSKINKDN